MSATIDLTGFCGLWDQQVGPLTVMANNTWPACSTLRLQTQNLNGAGSVFIGGTLIVQPGGIGFQNWNAGGELQILPGQLMRFTDRTGSAFSRNSASVSLVDSV